MVNIPLLLMGCGGVGRQLLRHIISCRPIHSKQVSHFIASYTLRISIIPFFFSLFLVMLMLQQGVRLRVVGVCDSKSMVVVPDILTSELHDDFLLQLCKLKSSGASLQEVADIGTLVLLICYLSKCTNCLC